MSSTSTCSKMSPFVYEPLIAVHRIIPIKINLCCTVPVANEVLDGLMMMDQMQGALWTEQYTIHYKIIISI